MNETRAFTSKELELYEIKRKSEGFLVFLSYKGTSPCGKRALYKIKLEKNERF